MATNYETLSREGLIYTLMMGIAQQEGRYEDPADKWTGDRSYVLDLASEVIKAVDGKRVAPMKVSQEAIDRIRGAGKPR